MLIACFNIRMKIIFNVQVSRTVGMSADQNPAGKINSYNETNQ